MPTIRTPPKKTSPRRSILRRLVAAEKTLQSKNPNITRSDILGLRKFLQAMIPLLIVGTGTVMSLKSTKKAIKEMKD